MAEETLKHFLRMKDQEAEGLILVDSRTVYLQKNTENRQFQLTGILNSSDTQDKLYDTLGKRSVDKFLEGYSSMFFLYGADGTGKTHTLLGNKENLGELIDNNSSVYKERGLMIRTMQQIFRKARAQEKQKELQVYCSCIEISKVKIVDMSPENHKARLRIEENETGWFKTSNLHHTLIKDIGGFVEYMRETLVAKEFYNSHQVLEINLIQADILNKEDTLQSYITFVELGFVMNVQEEEEEEQLVLELGSLAKVLTKLNNLESMSGVFKESRLTKVLKESICNAQNLTVIGTVGKENSHIDNSDTINFLRQTKETPGELFCTQSPASRISQRSRESRISLPRQDVVLCDRESEKIVEGVESTKSLKRKDSYLQLQSHNNGYNKTQYLSQERQDNQETIKELENTLMELKQQNEEVDKKYKTKREQLNNNINSLKFTMVQLKESEAAATKGVIQKHGKFLEEFNNAPREEKDTSKMDTKHTIKLLEDRPNLLDVKQQNRRAMRVLLETNNSTLEALSNQHIRKVDALTSSLFKLRFQVSPLKELVYKEILREIHELNRLVQEQQKYLRSIERQNVDKYQLMLILNQHKHRVLEYSGNETKVIKKAQESGNVCDGESFKTKAKDYLKAEMFVERMNQQKASLLQSL